MLGRAYGATGRIEEGEDLVNRGLEMVTRIGDRDDMARMCIDLAKLLRLQQRAGEALDTARRAEEDHGRTPKSGVPGHGADRAEPRAARTRPARGGSRSRPKGAGTSQLAGQRRTLAGRPRRSRGTGCCRRRGYQRSADRVSPASHRSTRGDAFSDRAERG